MSLARRSLQVVAFICTLVVGVASMAVIVTQTTWFKEWLRGFIVRQADDYVNGRLSIGRLDGNLFFGVELEDVDVTHERQDGRRHQGRRARLQRVLVHRRRRRARRHPAEPAGAAPRADGGGLEPGAADQGADAGSRRSRRRAARSRSARSASATARCTSRTAPSARPASTTPARIERLDASLGVKSNEDELTVDIAHVSLRARRAASFGVNALSGVIRRTPNEIALRERVAAHRGELAARRPAPSRNIEGGAPVVDLQGVVRQAGAQRDRADSCRRCAATSCSRRSRSRRNGPADRLAVDLSAREANARAGRRRSRSSTRWRRDAGGRHGGVEHFNVGARVEPAMPAPGGRRQLTSDITGQRALRSGAAVGRLPLSGTYAVNAARRAGRRLRRAQRGRATAASTAGRFASTRRADAYGGHATATGTVQAGQPLVARSARHAPRNVDLRNLPAQLNVPGVPSHLQFAYTLTGRGRVFSGDVHARASRRWPARTIAAGHRRHVSRSAPARRSTPPRARSTDLDVQQVGRGFDIRRWPTDRYRSRVNAIVRRHGSRRRPLSADARRHRHARRLRDVRRQRSRGWTSRRTSPAATSRVRPIGSVRAASIRRSSPATSGRRATLSGDVDADTTHPRLRGRRDRRFDRRRRPRQSRSRRRFGGLAIDTAAVDGSYANREGQLDAARDHRSRRQRDRQGAIALNDTGASNLTLHADSASLDRIGEIVGQPLKGAAIVDATVTGNARELQARGHAEGQQHRPWRERGAQPDAARSPRRCPNLTPAQTRRCRRTARRRSSRSAARRSTS